MASLRHARWAARAYDQYDLRRRQKLDSVVTLGALGLNRGDAGSLCYSTKSGMIGAASLHPFVRTRRDRFRAGHLSSLTFAFLSFFSSCSYISGLFGASLFSRLDYSKEALARLDPY